MTSFRSAHLKAYSYYGTGGVCSELYRPTSVAELADAVKRSHLLGQPLIALGGGSNSLVLDEPFAGAFVVFQGLDQIVVTGDRLRVGAGVDNTRLADVALQHGLDGVAWMNRLPGQIGGTVRMNARCYGGEISQVVAEVTAVSRSGEVRTYRERSMFRGYKDTVFMTNGDFIASVELQLVAGDKVEVARKMRACADDRIVKGQFDYPSCGCVFKNDYGIGLPSGLLLEQAGAKALKHGGAEVSPLHANFVYNKGASSRDILELTLMMRELVYREFGVWMAYEMEILGSLPSDLAGRVAEVKEQRPDQVKIEALKQKTRGFNG